MGKIKYVLFDAANTLIHKPALWDRMLEVLQDSGYTIPAEALKQKHKLLSECIRFPDRTTADFYNSFNAELLYALGIIPDKQLLDKIFKACTYLPWEKFDDLRVLESLAEPLAIISNFKSTLKTTIEMHFGPVFEHIFTSEELKMAKPSIEFYNAALQKLGIHASEALYIGDSLKLDIEPALSIGMPAVLIDRDLNYPFYARRITSMNEITKYLI